MKMIRHDYKFMQKTFVLRSVIKERLQKQPGHSFRLEQTVLLKSVGCDEAVARAVLPLCVTAIAGLSGARDGLRRFCSIGICSSIVIEPRPAREYTVGTFGERRRQDFSTW